MMTKRNDDQARETSEKLADGLDPIGRLIQIVKEMEPFIGPDSVFYCYLSESEDGNRTPQQLDNPEVSEVLVYRYYKQFTKAPTASQVATAISIIKGELWSNHRGAAVEDSPVLRLVREAARQQPQWQGSANDLLELLKSVDSDKRLLKRGESLSDSSSAMGTWLHKNQLTLRAVGIYVSRPKRTSHERYWAWQLMPGSDDTCDTQCTVPLGEPSTGSNARDQAISEADTTDAMPEDERKIWNAYKGEEMR